MDAPDDDYYGWRPTLTLERPVVLCGIPGTDVGRTARAVNLLTGVPLVWLDRVVEHRLGRSVEVVQVREGSAPRVSLEAQAMDAMLAKGEAPVVAASDATWSDHGLARRLEAACDVVLLHLDVASAALRIEAAAGQDPRAHYALREGGALGGVELRQALHIHEARYRHLARVVLVGERSPLDVATSLVAMLHELSGTR